MLLCAWFLALGIGAGFAKGNTLCDEKGITRLPTTATLTCDGTMNVYVDGKKIRDEKIGYRTADKYDIPVGSNILGIHCKQQKPQIVARILGMVGSTMLSGSSTGWLCTNQYYPSWNTSDFVDSAWAPPVARGKNVNHTIPYGMIHNISPEAEWIGTGDYSAPNNTLYCRVLLCPAKLCTYFSAKRIDNYRLVNHTFSIFRARNIAECALECAGNTVHCMSFNYITTTQEKDASCELNYSTHILKPASFLPAKGVVYYNKTAYP